MKVIHQLLPLQVQFTWKGFIPISLGTAQLLEKYLERNSDWCKKTNRVIKLPNDADDITFRRFQGCVMSETSNTKRSSLGRQRTPRTFCSSTPSEDEPPSVVPA